MHPKHLKTALHVLCQQQIDQRINTAREAMDAAQAAANSEGKSSAGDKYETGRAMMQLERDQHARLLAEALKLKQALDGIDPEKQHHSVQSGSLAITDQGNYYLSVSLGKLQIDQKEYIALSAVTPLGAALIGLKKGDTTTFNKRKIKVLDVQ